MSEEYLLELLLSFQGINRPALSIIPLELLEQLQGVGIDYLPIVGILVSEVINLQLLLESLRYSLDLSIHFQEHH